MRSIASNPTSYRWVPWVIAAAFVVVIAVNGGLAYFAISSSTGLVTEHAYETGNAYNRVLDAGAAQDALGWRGEIRFAATGSQRGKIAARMTDRGGRPLSGLSVTARIVRPVEPVPELVLPMPEITAGSYVGNSELLRPGQWEVRVAARRGDDLFEFAERILVK